MDTARPHESSETNTATRTFGDYEVKTVPLTVVERIVLRLRRDIDDRRGLRQAWDDLDEETCAEIIERWSEIIADEIKRDKRKRKK